QRIGIARAIALNPDFIVCDEPIAALDVSSDLQVVNLLEDLQDVLGLTYLFISHDLSMVRHIADRVAVMYLGKIMELAPQEEMYAKPKHPYTQALLSAVPVPDPDVEENRRRVILEGDIPSPANPPSGCVFSTRCPMVQEKPPADVPAVRELQPGHWVARHFALGRRPRRASAYVGPRVQRYLTLRRLTFLLTSLALLASCTGDGGADDDRHLRLLQWQAPSTANPYLSAGTKDVLASSLVLEPLAAIAPDASYVPKLADEIPTVANGGVSGDLTSITWKLKEGVVWSDGTPVTTADLIFTWQWCVEP